MKLYELLAGVLPSDQRETYTQAVKAVLAAEAELTEAHNKLYDARRVLGSEESRAQDDWEHTPAPPLWVVIGTSMERRCNLSMRELHRAVQSDTEVFTDDTEAQMYHIRGRIKQAQDQVHRTTANITSLEQRLVELEKGLCK